MKIFDENNNEIDLGIWEREEREDIKSFVHESDVVLELGARYGSCSCTINKILNNKKNQVSAEPDYKVWESLKNNRSINECDFHIIQGFVSSRNLSLQYVEERSDASYSYEDEKPSTSDHYDLNTIQKDLDLKFNTLIADCEGCLLDFMKEYPDFINQLRLIIFECDYPDKCDYNLIKENIKKNGFECLKDGFIQVWKR